MITIYEVKTGKPHTLAYMIDAKESVAGGFYTFVPPALDEPKKAVVREMVKEVIKEEKKVVPTVSKEEPKEDEMKPTVRLNSRTMTRPPKK